MLREFSAGALVLRHMHKQWWVAVIEPGAHGEPEDRKDIAALPKGNVDAGETPERTAVREVMEETGLQARIIVRLGSVKYVYSRKWSDSRKIFKVVTFFLMKYQAGRIGKITREMQHEVRHAYWMLLKQAPVKLSYNGERQMARKALQYLESNATRGLGAPAPNESRDADTRRVSPRNIRRRSLPDRGGRGS